MLGTVQIILIVYLGVVILNLVLIECFKIYPEANILWSAVHSLLSPITIFETINILLSRWYNMLEQKSVAIKGMMLLMEQLGYPLIAESDALQMLELMQSVNDRLEEDPEASLKTFIELWINNGILVNNGNNQYSIDKSKI